MLTVFHDSLLQSFREPAGAVPAGSVIQLRLQLAGIIASVSARECGDVCDAASARPQVLLHVRFDKDASTQHLQMQPAREESSLHPDAGSPDTPLHAAGTGYITYRADFTPPASGLYWYWFELCDPTDAAGSAGGGEGFWQQEQSEMPRCIGRDPASGQAVLTEDPHAWQITVYDRVYDSPDWIRGGVFYHIFIDRFAASGDPVTMEGKITRHDWGGMPEYRPNAEGEILNNDFFGGNLAGIRQKLPYLADLGVTCLYLSPIFEAYSSHKYDTSDYMKVDPMFGDEAGFTCLCAEAMQLGIRVICDGVFSHTGSDSRYFDIWDKYGDGAYHHWDSPYRSWYYFEPEGYQTWWGIKTLPRINKDVPSYRDFITGPEGVVRHWLRAGASGWRLDVVDELPSSFLEDLTAAAKAEKPDAMVLGEVWEDASNKIAYEERKNYFEGNKLDSVMNYPVRRGIIDYVREGDAQALAQPLQMILDHYPDHVLHALMNILGTHDTERIITALAGQKLGPHASREEKAAVSMDASQWQTGIRRLKIAVVLQMTLPGVPCIYYGDEAGMEGYNDPFNRRCFPWGHENRQLQDWYRQVIAIRRSHKVYADGACRLLAARGGLFAFERSLAGAAEPLGGGAQQEAAAQDAQQEANAPEKAAPAGGPAQLDATRPDAARLITVSNCGDRLEQLPLFGDWIDLLSGVRFREDVPVLPGQAMILRPADPGRPSGIS